MTAFSNPQQVAINGYTGIAMEPEISCDDSVLFFNNSNDPAVDTDLHYATRGGDYITFDYGGPVIGANTTFLDACPSITAGNDLYFISTRSYGNDLETSYVGDYVLGQLNSVVEVTGVSKKALTWVVSDATIARDGNSLWFTDEQIVGGTMLAARIGFALKINRTLFARQSVSDRMLAKINEHGFNYAMSPNNALEVFWTRWMGDANPPQNMVASRANFSVAFGPASVISACDGYVEAPSVSADRTRMYYHKQNGAGGFDIWMVSR